MVSIIKSASLKRDIAAEQGHRRSRRDDQVAVERQGASGRSRNDLLPDLALEMRDIATLGGPDRRVRRQSDAQIARIGKGIARFGMVVPVLITDRGHIIDGHHRVEAAKAAGLTRLPCIVVDHLSETEVRALTLSLNRLQEQGEWDIDMLRLEMIDLVETEFDMTVTGFTAAEIDLVLDMREGGADPVDIVPEASKVPVSRLEDLWQLGRHRILCGDALAENSYVQLLEGEQVAAVFTDPPYNIPIAGFVGGLGKHQHSDFAMGVGEMSAAEFTDFLEQVLKRSEEVLNPGGVVFACIDWRGVGQLVDAGQRAGLRHINTVVWNKGSGGMGGLYRSAHELIPVFVKGKSIATNNVELGRHGRDRTNVWTYPGANRPGSSAAAWLADHPTPKPVELVRDALLDVTRRGDIVLDPFSGSGTTIAAAEGCGRMARVIELDPLYVDVAIRRWEAQTGGQAVHAETGASFAEVATARAVTDPQPGAASGD